MQPKKYGRNKIHIEERHFLQHSVIGVEHRYFANTLETDMSVSAGETWQISVGRTKTRCKREDKGGVDSK